MATNNPFGAEAKLSTPSGDVRYYRLNKLAELGIGDVHHLPMWRRWPLGCRIRMGSVR